MVNVFKLAWRNIWRNRRRSLITMGAILFAVVIVAVTRSLQYGTYTAMESYAIRMFSGDIQIHRAGYDDRQTLNLSLTSTEKHWEKIFSNYPWIEEHTRRLTGFGLVSSDSASTGSMVIGIQPASERVVSTFTTNLVAGDSLEAQDSRGALLGQSMAGNLNVNVGDSVAVLTQGYHNVTGADLYRVEGLIRTGSLQMDRSLMVITLDAAQQLLSMPNRFTHLVLRTDNYDRVSAYEDQLTSAFSAQEYEVMSWPELQPELRQMIMLDNASGAIFLGFLLLLVGFEIFNSTAMSIMERTKEFGMMEAIGMKLRQISLLVLLELAIKVTLALAGGLLISLVLAVIFQNYPIPLGPEFQEVAESYGFSMEQLEFSTRPAVFYEPLIGVAVISLLSMIYPVVKLRQLEPVEALSGR